MRKITEQIRRLKARCRKKTNRTARIGRSGRYDLIAPLLEPGLEAAEKRRRRQEILARAGVADRTLRNWLEKYRKEGFDGLLPRRRSDQGKVRSLPEDILKEAIAIKEELPERSVSRVIEILEGEKRVLPGKVARSTLTRHLAKEGLTGRRRKKTPEGQPQVPEGTPESTLASRCEVWAVSTPPREPQEEVPHLPPGHHR